MPTTQTVVDTDNQFVWDRISSTFNDTGFLTTRLTDFDNGNTKHEYFDGVTGAPQVIIEKDIADVENWVQIFTSIDAWGTATKTTSFDNGVTREDRIQPELSEEAPAYVSSRIEYDDGAAFEWATRGYTYNFFGDLTDSFVRSDNGVIDSRSYQDGLMSSRTQRDTDDVSTWETIETTYDEGGKVADRIIQYDNGVVKYDSFSDGVRTSTYQGDNIDQSTGAAPEDGGAKSWETIETTYDEGGKVAFKSVVYDNGSTAQTIYEDGVRSLTLQEDQEDVFIWNATVTEYDADGKVSMKGTEYDNEDQTVWLYVEQALQTRIEVDRDGSDPWGARLTEYQSGEASVTLYDDVSDLPDPFLGFFENVATY